MDPWRCLLTRINTSVCHMSVCRMMTPRNSGKSPRAPNKSKPVGSRRIFRLLFHAPRIQNSYFLGPWDKSRKMYLLPCDNNSLQSPKKTKPLKYVTSFRLFRKGLNSPCFFSLMWLESRQYFALAFPKTNSIAVSLTITGHDHFISILKELPRDTLSEVQWFGSLPAKLQHGTVRVGRLERQRREIATSIDGSCYYH